jgi:TolB-like protein/Tfp pilus assembly protein PilF
MPKSDPGSTPDLARGQSPATIDATSFPDAINHQLQRVLSSESFIHSPQLCRFLRYIVEQEIAAQADQLKEYVLGVQVFSKGESFDPRIDTVVRTEARRLRGKLVEYYQAEGRNDTIEISLPKGGYRAIFHARSNAANSTAVHIPVMWVAIGVCLTMTIALAAVYWLWIRGKNSDSVQLRAIAVLPLENLSADPAQEYFSDGMTDALITDLAKIGGLRVISRTSVLQFKKTSKPISEVARQLGVGYVVEGTILRAGDRVRITAQLIAVPNERHLWAETYERPGSDVLSLQGEIARTVAGQVKIRLTAQERARLIAGRISPEAHDLYLKGRFYWHTRDTEKLQKSIEYFKQAIDKEAKYALAYAALSDSYSVLSGRFDGQRKKDFLIQAHQAANRALELDEKLGEAHASLAVSADDWDWSKAEQELRSAIELSPSYSTAHQWLSGILINTGRFEGGLSESRRARDLDPLSPGVHSQLGWCLYQARQYDAAIRQLRDTVELFPDFVQPYIHLGMAYSAAGMHRESIDIFQKLVGMTRGAPAVAALLAHAHARSGDKTQSKRLLNEYGNRTDITPVVLALLHMDVGDNEHALEWLGKGVAQHSMYIEELKVEPLYDSLRSDRRFTALLRSMNLVDRGFLFKINHFPSEITVASP